MYPIGGLHTIQHTSTTIYWRVKQRKKSKLMKNKMRKEKKKQNKRCNKTWNKYQCMLVNKKKIVLYVSRYFKESTCQK